MLSRIVLACFLHLLVRLHLKAAEPARIIIIQPGYPGSTRDAEGFVSQLADYVGGKTGLQGISGEYHNEEKRALSALAEKGASFGLVSLGFYLGHRQELGLQVLLQSKPKDNYVVVARKGEVKDVASLAGQPVAGGPLQEGRFLERIALQGKARAASWDQKPTHFASRALRDLVERKMCSAVVLTGRDYAAFKELYPKTLEKIVESDYYPPSFLVVFHARREEPSREGGSPTKVEVEKQKPEGAAKRPSEELSEELVKRIVRAFSGLSEDPRGKEILKTMGAEGFEEVRTDWLKELEGKYDGKVEEK